MTQTYEVHTEVVDMYKHKMYYLVVYQKGERKLQVFTKASSVEEADSKAIELALFLNNC